MIAGTHHGDGACSKRAVGGVYREDAELVIIAIAHGGALLGQVNYRVAQFARTLASA